MSDAFRCDGCRDLYSGQPAFDGQIQARIFTSPGGPAQANLTHNAGVTDHAPESNPTASVEWPVPAQSNRVELCVECTVEHIIPAIQDAVGD